MTSLVKQMETTISQRTTPIAISKIEKTNKNQYKNLSYAILPLSFVGGAYIGNDKFVKSKNTLENAVEQAKSLKLYKKELDFRNNILASFSDLVLRVKEGRPTEMPNCLLVKGQNSKDCEKLINWIGETGNARFIVTDRHDKLIEILELAEQNYIKTKDWTLLNIKNMDKLIDHNKVDNWVVESMKDIMSSTVDDYHTTIVFSTNDTKKLDKIALQSHRVKKIFDINEIDIAKFFENENKINLLQKNDEKLKKLLKQKNNKIIKAGLIGLTIGSIITAGIRFLINKKTK